MADHNGAKWREVPQRHADWQTSYERFRRWEQDGTWACVERQSQAAADAAGELDWRAQAGATIVAPATFNPIRSGPPATLSW